MGEIFSADKSGVKKIQARIFDDIVPQYKEIACTGAKARLASKPNKAAKCVPDRFSDEREMVTVGCCLG